MQKDQNLENVALLFSADTCGISGKSRPIRYSKVVPWKKFGSLAPPAGTTQLYALSSSESHKTPNFGLEGCNLKKSRGFQDLDRELTANSASGPISVRQSSRSSNGTSPNRRVYKPLPIPLEWQAIFNVSKCCIFCMPTRKCVCDLAEVLELSDSAISQHLRKLKDRNIVKTRRQGQTIFYSLVDNAFTLNLNDMFAMDQTREQHAFVLAERS
jgi:DNA-binding transcriptional ArsR family regulator